MRDFQMPKARRAGSRKVARRDTVAERERSAAIVRDFAAAVIIASAALGIPSLVAVIYRAVAA